MLVLSNPAPANTLAAPPARLPARKTRPLWRAVRWLLLLLILALASLAIPAVFQVAVRGLLTLEAWRHGGQVAVKRIEGSFYEPLVLHDSQWTYRSQAGSLARVEIRRAMAELHWPALLPWQRGHWFHRTNLEGVTARIEIPVVAPSDAALPAPSPAPLALALPEGSWWPAPAIVEAQGVDLTIAAGENYLRIQESRWTASEWESGVVEARQIVVKQPWLNRTFRNVKGTTALEGSNVTVANLQLERDVTVKRLTAKLKEMAKGVLNFDLEIEAFGGTLRTEGETIPGQRQIHFWANSNFNQIKIAPLASFLGLSDAAGGVIEDGFINFRGSPGDLPHSTASARLTARDFQWESRQWDSLILGASLLGDHMQVHEFELHQGKNELTLNGELTLPRSGIPWWQTEFAMDVAARIENLTDLSALVLPDFKYAAGKASIDGSIRGKDRQFHGQLLVSGSDITWRSAPIKELHGAIKLNGNELQLANFDLINQDDYVHGRGVINILGEKQYWGELRASVEDLALYASLLQKPIVPEPLAGGLTLNWSGEGSAARYSGGFFARLQKLRTLGASGPYLHPVNAELQGAYQPGVVYFSRFAVSDNASSFSAKLKVGEQAVDLREIRLMQGMEQRLEGDALLPLDVWSAWKSGDMGKLVNEKVPTQFALKAKNLRLAEALRLSGWKWPLDGGITGSITGKGAGSNLEMDGSLELREGQLPLGWNGDVLSQVTADFILRGHQLHLARASGLHASGTYTADGVVDLKNLRNPVLEVALQSGRAEAKLLPGWKLSSPFGLGPSNSEPDLTAVCALDLQLRGPAQEATVSGRVLLQDLTTKSPLDLQPLWEAPTTAPPPFLDWHNELWSSCKLDLAFARAPQSARDRQFWEGELKITGSGANPQIVGTLTLGGTPAEASLEHLGPEIGLGQKDVIVKSNGFPLRVTTATVTFRPGTSIDPTFDFGFEGILHALPFHASIFGPLGHRIAFIDSEEARDILTGQVALMFHQPEVGAEGIPAEGTPTPPVYPWQPIVIPLVPSLAEPSGVDADPPAPEPAITPATPAPATTSSPAPSSASPPASESSPQ